MDIPKKAGYHGSMRPNGTSQQLEKRRLQAIAMLESGKSYQTVANRLSASLSSVVRWVQSYRQEGRAGLKARPIPGRPARLSVREQAKLERILLKGPLQAGYPTDLFGSHLQWSCRLSESHLQRIGQLWGSHLQWSGQLWGSHLQWSGQLWGGDLQR
jgi:transposase